MAKKQIFAFIWFTISSFHYNIEGKFGKEREEGMGKKLAIIGAGAAGLAAAAMLAQDGFGGQILLLEKEARVGRKLLATGNGRCNLSNRLAEENRYYGNDTKRVAAFFKRFGFEATIAFFESLGIVCYELEKGRIYPRSLQAGSVVDALREICDRAGVTTHLETRVEAIEARRKGGYSLKLTAGEKINADIVLLCAGGKASAKLGSDGSGFAIMEGLGHHCTALYPAMVQMNTETELVKAAKGIKFEGKASLYDGEDCLGEQSGEILFTEYGLSGLPIFQLSVYAAEVWRRQKQKELIIKLDFLPEMSRNELLDMIKMRRAMFPERNYENYFMGLLNKRIGLLVFKHAKLLPLSKKAADLSDLDCEKLADGCKAFSLAAHGNRSFENAQITAGGLALNDFDNDLQSRLYKGLFAAGELLDVYGDCGGFNLQWAWTSAAIASGKIRELL